MITNVNKQFEQKNMIENLFGFTNPSFPCTHQDVGSYVLNLSVSHTHGSGHDPTCPSSHACVARAVTKPEPDSEFKSRSSPSLSL